MSSDDEIQNPIYRTIGIIILTVLVFVFLCNLCSSCTPSRKVFLRDLDKNAIQMRETQVSIIKIDTVSDHVFVYWEDLMYPFYYRTGPYKMPHGYKVGIYSLTLIPQ